MNNKEKLFLVEAARSGNFFKQALNERLDQFGYGEDADQYLALKGGEITPEEAELLKEELPSALGTGAAYGGLFGLGTAGLAHAGNGGQGRHVSPAKAGLAVGGGAGLIAGILQAIGNARTRSNINKSIVKQQ